MQYPWHSQIEAELDLEPKASSQCFLDYIAQVFCLMEERILERKLTFLPFHKYPSRNSSFPTNPRKCHEALLELLYCGDWIYIV